MPKNSYTYNFIAIALECMVENGTASETSRNITDLYSLEEYIRGGDVQKYKYNGKELDRQYNLNLYDYGARYYDPVLGLWTTQDPMGEKYPGVSPYVYCNNNPVKLIDPNGREVRVANIESFNVLLSSLPAGARSMITMNKNNVIDANSVNAAYAKFSDSGNLQALNTIVSDSRIVDFNATATSYNYVNAKTGQKETSNFESPSRENDFQDLLGQFNGTPEQKQSYAQTLIKAGFVDKVEVSGNFGATLRPADAQQPYPGGQVSTTSDFQVYVNPVGTTSTEKAKNVGHELYGHLYLWFIGEDPRHGGDKGQIKGNPQLDQQIKDREYESATNSNN